MNKINALNEEKYAFAFALTKTAWALASCFASEKNGVPLFKFRTKGEKSFVH